MRNLATVRMHRLDKLLGTLPVAAYLMFGRLIAVAMMREAEIADRSRFIVARYHADCNFARRLLAAATDRRP